MRICRLWVLPLASWPSTSTATARLALSGRSFTRSTLAPEPGSCRLYAGCRPGSRAGLSQARPEATTFLGFDITHVLTTRHRRFTLVHLLRFSPDALYRTPFPQRSPPRPLSRRSLRWFGASPCTSDSEGPTPIANAAPSRVVFLHQINLRGSRRKECGHSGATRPAVGPGWGHSGARSSRRGAGGARARS